MSLNTGESIITKNEAQDIRDDGRRELIDASSDTVDFTDDKNSHPLETLKSTILIWVCYIIVSKQTLHFTIGIFIILVLLYISHNYKDYLDDQLKKNTNKKELQEQSKFVNSLMDPLKYMLFIVASIGFIYYFMKENKVHKKNFSYLKFLFGANKCDHDK